MKIIPIRYCFILGKQRKEIFDLFIDAKNIQLIDRSSRQLPFWTELANHQCPHCLLDPVVHPYCPVASFLVDIVGRFDNVASYDQVYLKVMTTERHIIKNTTAQKGISSMLGIIFPASGCPYTRFFKPMVRFHLPLATEQDTVFRAIGMYLMGQYFLSQEGFGGDFNLRGLKEIYHNMHIINVHIAKRLRMATRTDSSLNGVILLDLFTNTFSFSIEDHMKEMGRFFEPYLSEIKKKNRASARKK
jgi:hypothetical protein